jgi:hypothetical protein
MSEDGDDESYVGRIFRLCVATMMVVLVLSGHE